MKSAKITKPSEYFLKKYGNATPDIQIECTDQETWGKSWKVMQGNISAMLYGMRSGMENLPLSGQVFYGKVGSMGELFHESEFEYK